MEIWEAIVLGLIQGLCEFLPVSSSGHLVIAERLLGIHGDALVLNVLLHLATLLAVVFALFSDVKELFRKPLGKQGRLLLISFLPTAALALGMKALFPELIDGKYTAFGFMLSAAVLLLTMLLARSPRAKKGAEDTSYKDAAVAGIAQGIAVIPGLSRSASTIFALTARGAARAEAVRFSFLMSIPVIAASAAYGLLSGGASSLPLLPLAFGFAAAFLSGLVSVKFMLKVFSKSSPLPFVIYLAAMSVAALFV